MIINLTQHMATEDQVAAGVVEPTDEMKEKVVQNLTFDRVPDWWDIGRAARTIAAIAKRSGHKAALIGGAPWLMSALERELINNGVQPLYSFSVRESQEVAQPDGSVKKVAVFRHAGFIKVV